jgi:cyclopropane fatty-acyl-phospholipid synthase-like methyltransferase
LIYVTKKFSQNNIENESKATLNHIIEKYNIDKYDFITSFKFISEFYNSNFQLANSQNLYKSFIKFCDEYLTQKGIILFLDLVSGNYDRNNPRPYTTQIMSN